MHSERTMVSRKIIATHVHLNEYTQKKETYEIEEEKIQKTGYRLGEGFFYICFLYLEVKIWVS